MLLYVATGFKISKGNLNCKQRLSQIPDSTPKNK